MTGVRHLLLATVAAVLALALGLALGAGPVGRLGWKRGWPRSRTALARMPGWWLHWPAR